MESFKEQLKVYVKTAFKHEKEFIREFSCISDYIEKLSEVYMNADLTCIKVVTDYGDELVTYTPTDDFIDWVESKIRV